MDELNVLATLYKQLKEDIEAKTKTLNSVKKDMQALAGKESVEADNGVKVSVFEVWEKKQTPAQYVKQNNIELEVIDLDEPEYQYRITISKDK